MFILDCTKPDAYKNIIAIRQGQLSINNIFRCRVITGGTDDLKGFGAVTTFLVNGREIKESAKVREGSVLDIVFPGDALVEGTHSLEVILTKPGERTIQTPELTYTVWNGITTGNGIQGQSQYPVLVTLINDVTELKNECERVLGQSNSYQLPPATPSTLGGIKVGSGLSITGDGTLSTVGSSSSSVPEHNHDAQYYTRYEMDSKLQYKANASHTHSNYAKTADTYTKQEVDKKIQDAQIQCGGSSGAVSTVTWEKVTNKPSTFPPSTHNHDTQYYTESEIDSKLLGKADTTHNHDANYSAKVHSHDDRYYTETEINNKLSGKADSAHNHDNDYYNKGEVDRKIADAQLGGGSGTVDLSWGAISGKPSTFPPDAHTHNEYSPSTHNHDTVYAKTTHSHTQYASSEHNHDTAYSPIAHTHDNYSLTNHSHLNYSDKNHNHHSDYYQKTEVDKMIQDAQLGGGSVSSNVIPRETNAPESNEIHTVASSPAEGNITGTNFNIVGNAFNQTAQGASVKYTATKAGVVELKWTKKGTRYYLIKTSLKGVTESSSWLSDDKTRLYEVNVGDSIEVEIDTTGTGWEGTFIGKSQNGLYWNSPIGKRRMLVEDVANPSYYNKAEVDKLIANVGGSGGSSANVTWETLTGKPSTFPPATHAHNEYADATHNHDNNYAPKSHNHDYAPTTHTHDNYADTNHNHDTSYATINHAHDGEYVKKASSGNVSDFNTVQTPGRYIVDGNGGLPNAPYSGGIWGSLFVSERKGEALQIFINAEGHCIYMRHFSSSLNRWYDWVEFSTSTHEHRDYATKTELNNVNATQVNGKKVWTGTQQEYDRLGAGIDANTLYFIVEG